MEYQPSRHTKSLIIKSEGAVLPGLLTLPGKFRAMVLFAHGRGSSRFSPRNQYVAKQLKKHNIATFLFDLLTPNEAAEDAIDASLSFNLSLLTQRVLSATEEAKKHIDSDVKIGYFGISTGAAALLKASLENDIAAIVCISGRPDLLWQQLPLIKPPTLFIAGGSDFTHLLAKRSFQKLSCKKKMTIIPGANSLFEEKGKLENMSGNAVKWLLRHLTAPKTQKLETLIGQKLKP